MPDLATIVSHAIAGLLSAVVTAIVVSLFWVWEGRSAIDREVTAAEYRERSRSD